MLTRSRFCAVLAVGESRSSRSRHPYAAWHEGFGSTYGRKELEKKNGKGHIWKQGGVSVAANHAYHAANK